MVRLGDIPIHPHLDPVVLHGVSCRRERRIMGIHELPVGRRSREVLVKGLSDAIKPVLKFMGTSIIEGDVPAHTIGMTALNARCGAGVGRGGVPGALTAQGRSLGDVHIEIKDIDRYILTA